MANKPTGAEEVHWDLSEMYKGLDDPQIDADVAELERLHALFDKKHRGNLARTLGQSIRDMSEIDELSNKVSVYLFLRLSVETGNEAAKAKMAEVEKRLAQAGAEHMVFYDLEIVALPDEDIERQAAEDETVAKHMPMLRKIRLFKPYMLTEEVEGALAKRSPFGPGAWSEFFDEFESDLRFDWVEQKSEPEKPKRTWGMFGSFIAGLVSMVKGDSKKAKPTVEQKSLTEMIKIMNFDSDADVRAKAMKAVNDEFGRHFAKYSAQTLYMVAGSKEVSEKDRGYKHPMHSRNMGSQIPDEVVEALHKAVHEHCAPLSKRFYRLKAKHLGLGTLRWSDRNAPMPFEDESEVTWEQAVATVRKAYKSFSPTISVLVDQSIDAKRIDAPCTKGRRGGAYNYSITLPGGEVRSFTFLNFTGTTRDVSTLAHELGHGVHGLLAGEAQGGLMMHAPMAYAETASVFGENVTFQFQLADAKSHGTEPALALLMGKCDDIINTVVRQISFSDFERELHGHDGETLTRKPISKLGVPELDKLWAEVTEKYYGAPGEIFSYEDFEHLWCYISHFHRPFYVYAYAFGELLTHSLYALKDELGDRFEPLYLDLLRSGSTKDVVALLEPFGIDPRDPDFWRKGIEVSLGKYLAQAEELSRQMGVEV